MKNNILFSLLLITAQSGYAQFIINAEIRPRTEYRHGYKSLIDTSQSAAVFTEQRSRLGFGYASEKYRIGITLQDVRVWGSQSQLNKTDGLTSVHEAWGEYSFTKKISAQLGRQEFNYDDERILGNVNWTQQARSHDAMLLKYADSTFTIHAGAAYNQNAEANTGTLYTVSNNYKEMHFIWLNKKLKNIGISLLVVNNGMQSPVSINSTRFSQTVGPYVEYKKGKLAASIRGYYQTGVDASRKDMQAYFAGADISHTLIQKLILGIGGEFLSGQSQTDTTKDYKDINHSFNPLYGTAHKFNGYMDYFYVANHINSVGLNDFYFKVKYKGEKWWAALDVHQFMSSADILNKKELSASGRYEAMSSTLGTEFDFTISCTLTKGVSFQAGYSHLLATESLVALKGGSKSETNNWMYLMFTFKPQILKN